MTVECQFGYYPGPLDFTVGGVTVSTLDGLDEAVKDVREDIVRLTTPPAVRDARSTGLPSIDQREFPIRHFLDIGIEALEG